jgi:HPr kinase/phosphorylase
VTPDTPSALILHATSVALGDRGLLILGRSGVGKSALALHLIALGASLVSDDQTLLAADGPHLRASCPSPAIRGLIEARGFGLLRMPAQDSARLILAIDLDQAEAARLPLLHHVTYLGRPLSLAHAPKGDHLPSALLACLRGAERELGQADGRR